MGQSDGASDRDYHCMNILSRLRLGTKITILLGLSVVAMIAIALSGATTLHQRMMDDRTDKLRAVVRSTVSVAAGLEARVVAHEITRDQAIDLFSPQRLGHAIR